MIRFLLSLYVLIIILDVVLSYFPRYRYDQWVINIKKMANFSLNPVRRILPPNLSFDFSPLVVILLIFLLKMLW